MKEQIQRLIAWSNGKPQGPYSIEIHPTNLCNLNCVMCGTQIEHKRLIQENPEFSPSKYVNFELTKEKMIEIVKESQELGVQKWLITGGGEPFVRKQDTLSVMKEIKRYRMYGNINTNGVLLNETDISDIINMRWDMIMFSVDSHIPKVHDFMRGMPGTFYKVRHVLNLFGILKKKSKAETPKIVFNTVICNKNYNKFADFIRFAADVNCSDVTFIPLIQFGQELHELALSSKEEEEFQSNIPKLEKMAIKYNIHTNLCSLIKQESHNTSEVEEDKQFYDIPCFEPFMNIVIRMDGKYSPCCMIDNYNDTLTKKSLQGVWFGTYFNELRKAMMDNQVPNACSHCVHMQIVQNTKLRTDLKKEGSIKQNEN